MSYSFDATMDALGRGGSQDPSQTNIFAQGQQQPGVQQPGQTDSVQAASTSGSLAGGPTTSGTTHQQAPVSQNANTTSARNSLMNQNAGKSTSPVDTQKLTSDIGHAKDQLQQEANSYVAGAGNLYGGGKVDAGTQQQIADFTKTGAAPAASATPGQYNFMQLLQGGNMPMETPYAPKTNTTFSQATDLETNGGLRNLYRQQNRNDAEYSGGEAALDAALLSQTPGFNQQRDQALRANADLQDTRSKQLATDNTGVNAQAGAVRDAAADSWRSGVRTQLQGGLDADISAAQAAKANWDTGVGDLQKSAQAGMAKDALGHMVIDPTLKPFEQTPQDLSPYFTNASDPTQTKWQDFVGDDQAMSYNAIQNALGGGGAALSGAGQYAGLKPTGANALNFNKNAFQNDVTGNAIAAMKKKQAGDAATKDAADLKTKAAQDEADKVAAFTASHPDATPKAAQAGQIGIVPEGAVYNVDPEALNKKSGVMGPKTQGALNYRPGQVAINY